ncbi:MAG: glycoside hydrolase family 2 protein [Williamsia sp.]|nr:glycoside hydrolase family 2 protein [Williamsia sp.]
MKKLFLFSLIFLITRQLAAQRAMVDFNGGWKFYLGDDSTASQPGYNDNAWRQLDLPHDWSIEGSFSEKHPATFNEGALPAGIGWYSKEFTIPETSRGKQVSIYFEGVYKNSEVWINGHYLGKRPSGYISFYYPLSPYLKWGKEKNRIAVRVDNSAQPDSRWYTGSGIYRNVWLITTSAIAVDHWGTTIATPRINNSSAAVAVRLAIVNKSGKPRPITVQLVVSDAAGRRVATKTTAQLTVQDSVTDLSDVLTVARPQLWSVRKPVLYSLKTIIRSGGQVLDVCETPFGIRSFYFDAAKGFFLNGKYLKILGVCNHHDLGALGAAVNEKALERQLRLLKDMGCNAIRTAHNPPAPQLLALCDKMGFLVMDEAFDMWVKRKNRQDYHLDFEAWHKKDLEDQVRRDRNHPSVFIWSIGNEIREQFDSSGTRITRELVNIVKGLDTTRPVTSALTENIPEKNFIYQSGALDLLGFNYKPEAYPDLPSKFPGQKLFASETGSALATRGHYDMPSDSARRWPPDSKGPFTGGNPDFTVSAYDNTFAYWGASHEAAWKAVKKYDFIAGLFAWSGFDFLGEPVPYQWPARSAYYGIIDLAGFPKDVYYLYQSEWTNKPVLHLFPHWNWTPGKSVDVWAYYNEADEVELYLNGKSLGVRKKEGDSLHVMWRVPFEPGTLKAVSRKNGHTVLTKEIRTAGPPAKIRLVADNKRLKADGKDLLFVTVGITDANGIPVPTADKEVRFSLNGPGLIAGVDNGSQTSTESFKAPRRKAMNGLCLAIIQSTRQAGKLVLTATADGLEPASLVVESK